MLPFRGKAVKELQEKLYSLQEEIEKLKSQNEKLNKEVEELRKEVEESQAKIEEYEKELKIKEFFVKLLKIICFLRSERVKIDSGNRYIKSSVSGLAELSFYENLDEFFKSYNPRAIESLERDYIHEEIVQANAREFKKKGYIIRSSIEGEKDLRYKGWAITIRGKPDLVALKEEKEELIKYVIEIKTVKYIDDLENAIKRGLNQVILYMWLTDAEIGILRVYHINNNNEPKLIKEIKVEHDAKKFYNLISKSIDLLISMIKFHSAGGGI